MSAAKLFLRADVANKLHTVMKPSELQRTRAEYMVFKQTIFKCCVYQEARLQKYFNFRDWKRKENLHKDRNAEEGPRVHDFYNGGTDAA
jgi:hypothetical protein